MKNLDINNISLNPIYFEEVKRFKVSEDIIDL